MTDIFTIGYGAREIDAFVTLLQTHHIAYLIDVRSHPYSRYKPEFAKQPLADRLAQDGIQYVFMGDALGGQPDDPACYTDGHVDYEKIGQTAVYQQGIARLHKARSQGLRVALMCSEGKPEQCHRSKLIGRTLAAQGVTVQHIDETGQLVPQEMVWQRGQSELPLPPDRPPAPPAWYDDAPPPEIPDAGWLDNDSMMDVSTLTGLPDVVVWVDADTAVPTMDAAQTTLQRVFGFTDFLPGQTAVIENILQKQNTLAVMPTGGGKSLCFQLPALLFGGLTVVVSPLISLMQDQVDQLRQWGVSAAALNSSLHPAHYSETMAHIRQGRVKLLYLAPETLLRPETQLLLQQCPIDSFVIDEAHCISAWGHDFRPEYRQLSQVRARLPQAVCLALTATATHRVRQDILQLLGIAADNEFVASFDRPNLRLWVQPRQNGQAQVLDFLAEHTGESGIIYCTTRRQVDELTIYLQRQGISALSYHAGLDDGTRQSNQRRFSQDDVAVMVATVAFGMGIDKSNVRFVLHYNLPKDLESYYQEIGRAGRDGLPADCLLLFSRGDLYTIQQLLGQGAAETQQAAGLRLQAMLCYAESQICRRRPLLDYFGETYSADDCAACDNCLRNDVPEQADLTIPAQKFLSCVLRTGQNFGMSHLIDVLRGAQTQKILQRRHNQLSTYGIGTEYSKKQWQQLVQQFIQGGLLVQDMEFGSLQLTEAGRAVLRGEPFMGVAVEVAEGKGKRPLTDRPARAVTFDYDQALFAQLRAKRKEIADEQGVPAFVILHDRSLMEMAARLPETAEALSHVYGVGEAKAAHYAPYFLPILADWRATHPHPPAPPVRPDGEQPDEAAERIRRMVAQQGNRTDGVWRVFQMGYSLAEIAAALGFTPDTILRHVAKMVEEGYSVELVRLQQESSLSEEEIAAVTAVFTELGMDKLRPVFDHFGGAVSYLDLKIVLLMMQD